MDLPNNCNPYQANEKFNSSNTNPPNTCITQHHNNVIIKARGETAYSEDLSNYFAPIRETTQSERLEEKCKTLDISLEQLKNIMNSFIEQLQKGLELHKEYLDYSDDSICCFKMCDAFIDKLPNGKDKGIFYALDFGGTNLRAVRAELNGDGTIIKTQVKHSLKYVGPSGKNKGLLDRRSTATQLFDHFADRVQRIMEISNDANKHDINDPISVGFTFSFPCKHMSATEAVLTEWTKGFETGRETDDKVEGKDVGQLLENAFRRKQIPAKLVAILNDTVGTLLSGSYQKKPGVPDCYIGMILGTGVNACYYEPLARQYGYNGHVINIECGNFNRLLPLTEVDAHIDAEKTIKGKQALEALVSGAYLGEIIRKFIIKIFHERTPKKAYYNESFTSQDASCILNDNTEDLALSKSCIESKWGVILDHEDLKHLKTLTIAVFMRSVKLAAMIVASICRKIWESDPTIEGISCCIDGSLYVKNPWYAEHVRYYIRRILGDEEARRICMLPVDDGSGKGAAIFACLMVNQKS